MSNSVAQQISLIRSHIFTRRFDAATLLIVESVMVSKDVMEFRSSLREFFRSESMSIMRENAEKPLEKKLLDLEFLVQSFALLGDVEACENALLCFQKNSRTDGKTVECFESLEVIEKLKQLKDCATTLAASHSVQAQAAKYTKSKQIKRSKACSTIGERTQSIASTLFRNGIRKRNLRRLQESQSLLGKTDERNTTEI
ncbi:uncharacterized protein LOC21394437 isoform X2 [Morus notabilis]|uniref:uncharacterized protein LOC21394437 isoform X2 n=1 Tax=Morus notabilis TaxID=981085 RepID=UPI000CED5C68|nr:uncharacterized protein LOC21394437 isoform X2 [Morus notabilis]